MATEQDIALLAAIGEALDHAASSQMLSPLDDWLRASEAGLRLGACIAAEAGFWTRDREMLIVDRTSDNDWDVRGAAEAALEPIRRSRELKAIVNDLEHPDCRDDRRWSLLDAALAFGYPGIVYTPRWFERLKSHLPYAARRYATQTLNAKRKSLREELQRRERPGS